ncbi:MAG: NB-ARC domain-containing protein [Chloroflexota bacterium]|nr:hypothetical protein [Chloroflexota bacterium]
MSNNYREQLKTFQRNLKIKETSRVTLDLIKRPSELRQQQLETLLQEAYQLKSDIERTLISTTSPTERTRLNRELEEVNKRINEFRYECGEQPLDYRTPSRPEIATTRPRNYFPLEPIEPNSLFQARPGELNKLGNILSKPSVRLGLVGMAGTGKTELALQLVKNQQANFSGGVFWTSLEEGGQAAVIRAMAELGNKTDYPPPDDNPADPQNERKRAVWFCRYLAKKPNALLILDNVEEPNKFGLYINELAGEPIRCSIIYTTRLSQPSAHPSENKMYTVGRLEQKQGLALLLPGSKTLKPNERVSAIALYEKVGGLPLALVQLQALLRDNDLQPSELLADLQDRTTLQVLDERAEERSLRVIFKLILENLKQKSPEALPLFKLAAHYPATDQIPLWLLGLATALELDKNVSPQVLAQLKNLSLLETFKPEHGYRYVRIHPLVAEFGRGQVKEERQAGSEFLEEAALRLVAEFLDLSRLEHRANQGHYWECLEQVRLAQKYARKLSIVAAERLAEVEKWLDRESTLLASRDLWPNKLPALFYQQMYNRAVEKGWEVSALNRPKILWLRLLEPVGSESLLLLRLLKGHTAPINSVAFSLDGKFALTGSSDRTVRLWDTATGKLINSFEEHALNVNCVAFFPDGKQIGVGSSAKIYLWDITTGKLVPEVNVKINKDEDNKKSDLYSLAISPNGKSILVGFYGEAHLISLENGDSTIFTGQRGYIRGVAFFPDGKRIVTGAGDGTIWVWDTKSGEKLKTFEGHTDAIRSLDTNIMCQVLSGAEDSQARLWEGSGESCFIAHHSGNITSVSFSPDGRMGITGSEDHSACLWKFDRDIPFARLDGHRGEVNSVAFSGLNGELIALTGGSDNEAILWKVEELPIEKAQKEQLLPEQLKYGTFSPDGAVLFTATETRSPNEIERQKLISWEVSNNTSQQKVFSLERSHTQPITCIAVSSDGRYVLTGSQDAFFIVCEYPSGELPAFFSGDLISDEKLHSREISDAAFSPDNKYILTGSRDGTARLWCLEGSKLVNIFEHDQLISRVAFSPDGNSALTSTEDGILRLWSLENYNLLQKWEGHTDEVSSLAFSPDGKLLLSAGKDDKTLHLWNLIKVREKMEPLLSLKGHKEIIKLVSFSPDGSLVLSSDSGCQVRLWDTATGRLCGAYITTYPVLAVWWSLDSPRLVLADDGGSCYRPHFYQLQLEGDG